MEQQQLLDTIAEAVIELDASRVEQLTRQAIDEGIAPNTIIVAGLSQGIKVIGERFKCAEVFIPEVLVACDAYYAGLVLVKPLIKQGQSHFIAKMVIGTIHGDIHTVGKDVAVPVFQAAGFDVIDLGTGVPDQKFVEAVREHKPQLVGFGTYMTSTFMHTKDTVRALAEAGLRDGVKIICGGPAVDAAMARKMGADDATDNAWEAVEKMKRLVAELGAA